MLNTLARCVVYLQVTRQSNGFDLFWLHYLSVVWLFKVKTPSAKVKMPSAIAWRNVLQPCFQIYKANEDSDIYDDNKINGSKETVEVLTNSETQELKIPDEEEKIPSSESTEVPRTETKNTYERTLSGGLQSPRAEVPKTAILQRINSKKAAKSYQLGNQLSCKWSSGAGPRIGCVADYPVELRVHALEFVNLSPRNPPTPSYYRRMAGLASPTAGLASSTASSTTHLEPDLSNGDGTSAN